MTDDILLLIKQIRAQQWLDAAITAMRIVIELTGELRSRSETFASSVGPVPVFQNLPMEELCARLQTDAEAQSLNTGSWDILLEIIRRLLK